MELRICELQRERDEYAIRLIQLEAEKSPSKSPVPAADKELHRLEEQLAGKEVERQLAVEMLKQAHVTNWVCPVSAA